MKHLVITTLLVVVLCFGANLIRAPKIEAEQIIGNSQTIGTTEKPSTGRLDQHIISSIPDLRSTAGSSGKNIVFAEDGQSVAVIYGLFSGDPTNIMQVYVSYSADRGNTWFQYGPLSTYNCRRAYSAIDAEDDFHLTGRVHFAWNEAAQISGSYDSSPCFYAKEVSFPDGLITAAIRLPNSGERDVWMPCIGVKDSFVVITAMNNGTFLTTYDVYIWRSTGYGETWDTGRVFLPGPTQRFPPHFRFGNNGYMFFLWLQSVGNNRYWPYYCESFDYALTWTEPRPLWDDTPPYPDMSNVTGWWYQYDCEVVRDTPTVAIKLGEGNYDYGEIWVYRPDSGVAGNWHFKGTKLVGGNSTVPQTFARYPTIAADDNGNAFIGYQAIFETPTDTGPDVGLFARPAIEDSWYDWGRITFNGNAIEEKFLEFAHNAPLIANGDSSIIGMIYTNASDYPTTGNLYFDYFILPDPPIPPIVSLKPQPLNSKWIEVSVIPNPFCHSVKFILPTFTGEAKISIFDVTGKLVRTLKSNNQKPTTDLIWDGRNQNGRLTNPGIYFYTIKSGSNECQGKIILTRQERRFLTILK